MFGWTPDVAGNIQLFQLERVIKYFLVFQFANVNLHQRDGKSRERRKEKYSFSFFFYYILFWGILSLFWGQST